MMDIYNRRISVQWVCGIAFFVIALARLAIFLKDDISPAEAPFLFAGNVIILAVAVPIMINSKIKASLAAAMMSISFGICGVLEDIEYITTPGLNEIAFYICIILIVASGAMVIFGIGLLFEYKYNSERLKIITILSLVVFCIPILLGIRRYGFTEEIWWMIKDAFPPVLFLVLLFIVLLSPEIRFYTAYNRLLTNVIYIREVFSVAKDSWIYRDDLKRLLNYKNEEWTPVGGPIKEEQIYIIHIYKSTLRMIIQRWENGTERLKIAQNRTDVIIDKINMQLTEIIPDGDIENCESFTIFGTDGIFIRLLVRDDKETIRAKKKAEKLMKNIDPRFESGEE